MSGGSLDYACYKVSDISGEVERRARSPLHKAFAAHLLKVSSALHDLEWLWSGDCSEGSEVSSIEACLPKGAVLAQAVADAEAILAELNSEIEKAKKSQRKSGVQ